MKKVLPLLVLLGACTPDIAQEGQPPAAVSPLFDLNKKIVPAPNDLAKDPTTGKIVVPDQPTDTAAQKEFNHDYLGQLDGFPFESTASVTFNGDLKPETVSAKTVLVIDVTNPAAPAPVDNVTPAYIPPTKQIVIPPPGGAWTRGHHYAVALVGGADGLRGAKGEDVIGSSSWALVSGKSPLITCTDPKNLDTCTLFVDVIPSSNPDPAAKLKEEKTAALQIEQIRKGYEPILDALTLKGLDRSKIPQIWTFGIIDSGEVTFDPANSVIPFPNNVVRDPSTGNVKLPNPKTGKPLTDADCQTTDTSVLLVCGLNTLDGFSTIAPLVSENSDKLGAVAQATLASNSLSTANVGLAPLASQAHPELRTKPKYTPCLNCTSSKDANGNPQTSPQELQWRLDVPLDEKTTYAAWVTTDPKDDKGRNVIPNPVFALVRSAAPLVENGKSAVNILTDDQAAQLEVLRVGYKPMFDALETQTIHRANLALAFPFTTLSVSSILEDLNGYPAKIPGLPDYPLKVTDVTAAVIPQLQGKGVPTAAIAKVFAGAYLTPTAVTGPGGTLNVTSPAIQQARFFMTVPVGTAPAGGWPVVIYNHGFGNWSGDGLLFANSAAATGHIFIAADALFHGERSSCTGVKTALKQTTDDAGCADPTTMMCDEGSPQGICVNRAGQRDACNRGPQGDIGCTLAGQGLCAADSKCQGAGAAFLHGADGNVAFSGWNMLSPLNFFGTRDNMRQEVIDLSALVRVLKGTDAAKGFPLQLAGANGGVPIPYSTAEMDFVGHSLGGIGGSLFTAVSPDIRNVVLNVTGGAWGLLIENTVTYAPLRDVIRQGLAAQGINIGTPAFDNIQRIAQWTLDQADPANVAYRNVTPVELTATGPFGPPKDRKVFVQFIEGDQSVPNIATIYMVSAANRTTFAPVPPQFGAASPLFVYEFTEKGETFDATTATADSRHRFLLQPPTGAKGVELTTKAQTQAATFLATGALP